jgi:hypothetical protein
MIKEIMYLIDNFYFQSIKPIIFRKRYFNDFKKCEITRGESLSIEGEIFSHIYLIKEGEVEITLSQNLLDLNNLINILEEKIGRVWEDKGTIKSGKNSGLNRACFFPERHAEKTPNKSKNIKKIAFSIWTKGSNRNNRIHI